MARRAAARAELRRKCREAAGAAILRKNRTEHRLQNPAATTERMEESDG